MGSIWSASAVTPAATDRIPVDVSSSGAPSRWTGQNVADAASRIGVTVNALGSINSNTTIDLANGAFVTATITGSLTFAFSNPPATGQGMQFVLILTNGGSAVVTWPGTVTWTGGTAPTLRSSGVDVLRFYTSNGGANWYGELAYDEQSIDAGAILTGTIDAARLPAGTTSAAGALELATVAEAETGTDTARAVTPEGVAAAIAALAPSGGETVIINEYLVGSHSWDKHANAKWIDFFVIPPGGSGAGGARKASGVIARGGGGGAGSCPVYLRMPASAVPSSMTVVVGAVGAAGAGATSDGTEGSSASASADSTVGTLITAKAGGEGLWNGAGSGVPQGGVMNQTSASGANGGAGANGSEPSPPSSPTLMQPTGGGGGGCITAADAQTYGTRGATWSSVWGNVTGTILGATRGALNGGDGGDGESYYGIGLGGAGGGPGDTSGTVGGGDGGDGGFPGGGGGGGGGARNGSNGGDGGLGGAGITIIIQTLG